MANTPKKLEIHQFDKSSPLHKLPDFRQKNYLIRYLADLGAQTVLEEPNYFDRDYLAEFAAFYCKSTAGYPNTCRRLHFFAGAGFNRSTLRSAAAGRERAIKRLQENYLGFVVIRPIPATPLGRTVLAWYEDLKPDTPRVVTPSRDYHAHVAGIRLTVHGLAWQQQDTGVGACATVGLWSMLHSSAFDDHHAIPTTADITQAAHQTASLGDRVFPSSGLSIEQVREAIKEHDLSPIVFNGDLAAVTGFKGFSIERFSSSCASLIRSGYPVLIVGQLGTAGLHAVCAVGFRSCSPSTVASGQVNLQDSHIPNLYIHDDNIGPSARLKVVSKGPTAPVELVPDSPPSLTKPALPDPIGDYPPFTPHLLLVAAHNDLRTSPDTLHRCGITTAEYLAQILQLYYQNTGKSSPGLTLSTRYLKLSEYMTYELNGLLKDRPQILARVRLKLAEKVQPMSLHLGIVRIGLDDATPLADILYDTTDNDRNHPAFAHVFYADAIGAFMSGLHSQGVLDLGVGVSAC